tara:strand:- start:46 stop:240 length:195 start_codon:yes stop_codon:yes gene_type:complete
MKKYNVYAKVSGEVFIGTYGAKNKQEAVEAAEDDTTAAWHPSLCHQCSNVLDPGDPYDPYAEEV